MIGIVSKLGILAILGLLALVIRMLMRVPDPKHAFLIEMLSRMEHAPDTAVSHPQRNYAASA